MASHVLRAPVVEADTGFAIRVLRDAVSYITANVRQLQGKELENISLRDFKRHIDDQR